MYCPLLLQGIYTGNIKDFSALDWDMARCKMGDCAWWCVNKCSIAEISRVLMMEREDKLAEIEREEIRRKNMNSGNYSPDDYDHRLFERG